MHVTHLHRYYNLFIYFKFKHYFILREKETVPGMTRDGLRSTSTMGNIQISHIGARNLIISVIHTAAQSLPCQSVEERD